LRPSLADVRAVQHLGLLGQTDHGKARLLSEFM
jgi:hypothetical protein